jgi:hypothetical protein
MNNYSWRCPFCDRHVTVTSENVAEATLAFEHGNTYGPQVVYTKAIVCPNPTCREYTLEAGVVEGLRSGIYIIRKPNATPHKSWRLVPAANVRMFPDYVRAPILEDYREACLIRSASPKASATLARRCLQGMIRDFWNVRKDTLAKEIEAIRGQVDPLTWDAIDSVRRIGNIGAHMEKDINLVIDVDPGEAQLLIELIETLIHDWYVVRHERQERLAKIVATADAKKLAKVPAASQSATSAGPAST